MTLQIDLKAQIAAVNRELFWRAKVYPRRVVVGSMSAEESSYQLAAMLAVRETLAELLKQKTPELDI